MAAHVRAAAASAGRQVLVSMDLPGPKLRTGPIADGPALGQARVTREETGQLVAPARIWLTPADSTRPSPAPIATAGRPALAVGVDQAWLACRRVGQRIALVDARGRRRIFTVTQVGPGAALAEGQRNAYIADGTGLSCQGTVTSAAGIPPLRRRLSLAVGGHLVLTSDLTPVDPPSPGRDARIGCTLPQAITAIRPGDAVLFDDGAIAAVAERVGDGEAILRIVRTKPGGQCPGAQKGINLPDTVLPLTALSDQDEDDLPFVAEHADLVAVSFVRTAADVEHVLDRLRAAGPTADDLGLILKIETRQGFENLPSILLTAMRHPRLGVMIARGDLAVEVGFERLSEVPRQIRSRTGGSHGRPRSSAAGPGPRSWPAESAKPATRPAATVPRFGDQCQDRPPPVPTPSLSCPAAQDVASPQRTDHSCLSSTSKRPCGQRARHRQAPPAGVTSGPCGARHAAPRRDHSDKPVET